MVTALLAAGWTAVYAVVYVLVARHQTEPAVAWWYVAVLACAVVALLAVPFAGARVVLASAAAVLLAACVLLGALSVGLLLVPGAVLAVLAAVLPRTRSRSNAAA